MGKWGGGGIQGWGRGGGEGWNAEAPPAWKIRGTTRPFSRQLTGAPDRAGSARRVRESIYTVKKGRENDNLFLEVARQS